MSALSPGSIFANDFEVIRPLSVGGMGSVYVVVQKSTGKQRALKLMLPQLVSDPALRRRFEQEARVGSLIDSDHVIEIVAAGVDEPSGMPWLVMELLEGADLADVIRTQGALSLASTKSVLQQLCHAVGAAHAAGIVHRDLKPENFFLADSKRADETRVVKVLDFGIARIAAEAATRHTAALGSPMWMAPEQTERGVITPAADVWAIGLIAFHLLTARMFWLSADGPDGSVGQLMRETLLAPIPSASERAARYGVGQLLPRWFDAWFARCVDRAPGQRFASAADAYAAFDRAGAGSLITIASAAKGGTLVQAPIAMSAHPRSSGPPSPFASTQAPVPSATTSPPRPNVALVGGLVALLLVVVAASFGIWSLRHRTSSPPAASASASASNVAPPSSAPPVVDAEPVPPLPSEVPAASAPGVVSAAHRRTPPDAPPIVVRPPEHAVVPPPPSTAPATQTATQTGTRASMESFDHGASAASLGAINLQSCKRADGPTGLGHAKITFDPGGNVAAVVVDGGPFVGTVVGSCIASKYRGARVPPFGGAPVSVGKAFTIN